MNPTSACIFAMLSNELRKRPEVPAIVNCQLCVTVDCLDRTAGTIVELTSCINRSPCIPCLQLTAFETQAA